MTTGKINIPGTAVSTQVGTQPGRVGLIMSKTWSGGDYPPTKPVYTNVYPGAGRRKVWVKPPKRARIVEHPYSLDLTKIYDSVVRSYHPGWGTYYTHTFENYFAGFASTDLWSSNDDLLLYGKLRDRVAGSGFNAGVFLGEGHQSLKLITNAAVRITRSLRAFKKFNFQGAYSELVGNRRFTRKEKKRLRRCSPDRDAASNWLELQYGWLPLLSDAHEGAVFLAHHLSTPLQQVIRVHRAKPGSIVSRSYDVLTFSGTARTDVRIKATLREKNVAQLSGLTDPLSVAWELVPFSFVVDWFIPIGQYLDARGLASSLQGTFVVSRKFRATASHPRLRPPRLMADVPYTYERVVFTRTVSTTLAIPLPEVKPLGKSLSWAHCVNALALLTQMRP